MKIIVSHDVDHIRAWEHKWDLIIPKFIVRNLIEYCSKYISGSEMKYRFRNLVTNKWQNLNELMEFDRRHDIPSTFFVAVDNKTSRAVGMGRAISDGISDAYIQDVVVLKEYRGMGIGKEIVQNLLNYCLEKNLVWIGLVAEPGTRAFYSPLGFQKLPGEPLVYQPKQDSED